MENLHLEFVRLGRERHKLKNRMLYILPQIYESGIYKKYADKVSNMSKSAVITFSKELRKKSIGKIMESDFAELAVDSGVDDCLGKCCAVPEKVKMEFDENMTFLFLKLKKKLDKNFSNKEAMTVMLKMLDGVMSAKKKGKEIKYIKNVTADKMINKKISTDGTATAKCIEISTQKQPTRYIKTSIQKTVTRRSDSKCEYPGCNIPAEHFHHTRRFSETHAHEGLVHLCREHHEMAHNGLIKGETKKPAK